MCVRAEEAQVTNLNYISVCCVLDISNFSMTNENRIYYYYVYHT